MQKLNFRIFDKKNKKMIEPFCIEPSHKRFQLGDDGYYDILFYDTDEHSDIMRYTELQDRNKKPIYEGDIIGYLDNNGKDSIVVVVFRDGGFYPFAPDYLSLSISEVIGNIFENPELLRGAKCK